MTETSTDPTPQQTTAEPGEKSKATSPPNESLLENIRRNLQEGLQTGRSGIESGYRDAVRNLGEGYETARTSIKSGIEDARTNLISGLESARQGIDYGITKTQESLGSEKEPVVPPVVNTRPATFIDEKTEQRGMTTEDGPPGYDQVQREGGAESLEEITKRLERGIRDRGLLSRNPPRQQESGQVGGD
jgi:hypothetical protein